MKNNGNINSCDFKTYCPPSVKNSIFIKPLDNIELMVIINKLDSSKSPASDNIGPRLVKYIAPAIINPLVDIFNKSFATGIVPDRLKIAKVFQCMKREIEVSQPTTGQYL